MNHHEERLSWAALRYDSWSCRYVVGCDDIEGADEIDGEGVGLQSGTRHSEGTDMPSVALGRRTTHPMSIRASGDLMVIDCMLCLM